MSKVARIAVAGAGWWGQGWHIPHISRHPQAALAAIVESSTSPRASNAAQQLQTTAQLSERYQAPVFKSLDELLSSPVASELDGVLVGTPHAMHAQQAMMVMKHGLHVLVEKPMTTDVEEARMLAEAAAVHVAAGKYFAINNTANWRGECRLAAEAIAAGRIGKVQHVMARMHSPLLWLFDDPANEGWISTSGNMLGNGFGWGQLSHMFVWILAVTQLQPSRVFAHMSHSSRSGADLHDAAIVDCEGGGAIVISGSAGLPGDAHGSAPVGKQIDIVVFGTEGSLSFGGDDQDPTSGVLEIRRHDGQPAHEVLAPPFQFEKYEADGTGPESIQAFVQACRGESAFVGAGAQVGLDAVRVIDAAYRSTRSGQPETCA